MTMKLFDFQEKVLEQTKDYTKVAYFLQMGLGKTFVGSEKAVSLGKNILIICQKSKVNDWVEHFDNNYNQETFVYDLTKGKVDETLKIAWSYEIISYQLSVFIINYDLAWRRPELLKLTDFTLMLDESSLIQNETSKRSKFILKLKPSNVILLSGTPVSGKYEQLWSQCNLLGWNISKKLFYRQYLTYTLSDDGYPIISGYKNVERLKRKLRAYGAVFLKSEDVLDLPEQIFIDVKCDTTKEFKKFKKDRIITIEDKQLVGDTTLTNLLYQRMLCSQYNVNKLEAFEDLINSCSDRIVVFYNFNDELVKLSEICRKNGRTIAFCNGNDKQLEDFEKSEDCIILVQYQAGAMGLNLQKANKIIYFSPTLSSDLFEQSKKRIHRIGQNKSCWYYYLKSGIDYRIYDVLEMRRDYTEELFKEDLCMK